MKPTVTLLGYALVIIGLINCEKNNPSSESNNYIIVVDEKSFISSSAIVELPGNPGDTKVIPIGQKYTENFCTVFQITSQCMY